MGRKVIFFDIDHTLVSHVGGPHVPPGTREALRRLREAGHVPAIATGRGAFLCRPVAAELGIELLVCADGAQIVMGQRVLSSSWLPETALRSFLGLRGRGLHLAALDERFVYADEADEEFRNYFDAQAGYPCVRPFKEMSGAILCYLMTPSPPPPGCGLFSEPPEDVQLEHMRHFVEARAGGTSKWRGIELALERIGADAADVVAFGDGLNDLEMLARAPVGVAVGANDRVRAAADLTAGDIDQGGILTACLELGLI